MSNPNWTFPQPSAAKLEKQRKQRLDEAQAIVTHAERRHLKYLTPTERGQIDFLLEDAQRAKDLLNDPDWLVRSEEDAQLVEKLERNHGHVTHMAEGGFMNNLAGTLRSASWSPHVPVPYKFPAKAIIGDVTDAAVRVEPGISALPIDSRYAYGVLRRRDLPVEATVIQELVQTSRIFPALDQMAVGFASGTTKPTTTTGATLQPFQRETIATVSELLPVGIVNIPAFEQLVNTTLRDAYRAGLDHYVVGQLVSQAGTVDDTGDDLFEQLRKAVTSLQSAGFEPSVALVNPEDAETLDLTRADAGEGQFMLNPAPRASGFSPLWSLRLVATPAVTDPIVLDPSGSQLWLSDVEFSANPFEQFAKNQVRFRFEGDVIVVVNQPGSIHVISSEESG